MPADMNNLVPEFREKTKRLIEVGLKLGVEMRPYFTLRTPFEQAKLWRQSRTKEEIENKIIEFRMGGAEFLAYCIESVGIQNGEHVTNAPPGFSWHQWGEAADCLWVVEGKAEWSTTKKINGINGYTIYAEQAKILGLDAGGNWKSFKDWPHVQLRSQSSPEKLYSLKDINEIMKDRFSTNAVT
ncbi:MAG: M15 family metallopeptidase [Nitrospira sp.]|nr:M15 family metallopeptidase [Nitrospira sp.]